MNSMKMEILLSSRLLTLALFCLQLAAHGFGDSDPKQVSAHFCRQILAGEGLKPVTEDELYHLIGSWKKYDSAPHKVTNASRTSLSDQVVKDLELPALAIKMSAKAPIRRSSLNKKIEGELQNPLNDRNEIRNRQQQVKTMAENGPLRQAFKNLTNSLAALDIFSMAVYADPRTTVVLGRNHRSAEPVDGDYFSSVIAATSGERLSSFADSVYLPETLKGLALFFANDAALESLFGFKQQRYLEFQTVRRDLSALAAELRKVNLPLFQRLAHIFEIALKPDTLLTQQDPLELWPWLFKSNRVRHRNQGARLDATARLSALVASMMAIDELNFLNELARPGIEEANAFTQPIFEDRDKAYLNIVKGHNLYIYRTLPQSVANSVLMDGSSDRLQTLVGPNKRGKSIYQKMIGSIALMGRMGAYVPAESVRMTVLEPWTGIEVSGSTAKSESTFSAQAVSALKILNEVTSTKSHTLILIDETFYGTTARQQLAIAKVYLRWISRTQQIGVMTFQNPAVQKLVIPGVAHVHNTQNYTIEPGPSRVEDHNAVDILEEEGYPAEFIREVKDELARLPIP